MLRIWGCSEGGKFKANSTDCAFFLTWAVSFLRREKLLIVDLCLKDLCQWKSPHNNQRVHQENGIGLDLQPFLLPRASPKGLQGWEAHPWHTHSCLLWESVQSSGGDSPLFAESSPASVSPRRPPGGDAQPCSIKAGKVSAECLMSRVLPRGQELTLGLQQSPDLAFP